MSIRKLVLSAAAAAACLGFAATLAASPASAATAKQCNAQYKAAKAGGTLNGMKKKAFMAQCEGKTAAAPAPTPAAAAAAAPKPAAGGAMAGKPAAHVGNSRVKACGVKWKAAKAAGQTNGMKWPQYEHQCVQAMKAAGQ
ncbi:MAG: hypothetical protein KGI57_05290 [Hyphomicrobiales bacterium]|nr:hypothetical protein [Hyphomicrobiales bacterium]MDE2017102.1 hypothetical protein [Hyphomicrobiales bacterium]